MPRIAATLGVFALVVCAMALNMAQFPIEYDLVARPDAADESEESAAPAEIARTPAVALRQPASVPREGNPGPTEPPEPVQRTAGEEGDTQEADWAGAEAAEPQYRALSSAAPDETEAPYCDATGCSLGGTFGMDVESAEGRPSAGEEAWSPSEGIYNPLEPQPGAGTAGSGEAPPEFPGLGTATEAEPGPPYAAAGPTPDTEDPDLIPVDPTVAAEAAGEDAINGVVRLPPVDEAWPSVSADIPSPDAWHPSADD